MHIDEIIKSIDQDISWVEKRTFALNEQKNKYLKIQEQYPNCFINKSIICIENAWSDIKMMRIEPHYQLQNQQWVRHLTIKFPIDLPVPMPGMHIYASPFRSSVATVKYDFSASPRKAEINVLDYGSLIPDDCPSKNKFMSRIKKYLLRHILQYNYNISETSFEKASFQ